MSQLVQKLKELGKYEIGFHEFREVRYGFDNGVIADLVLRWIGNVAEIETIIKNVTPRISQEDYFGALMEAALVLVPIELIKYTSHRVFQYLGRQYPTKI